MSSKASSKEPSYEGFVFDPKQNFTLYKDHGNFYRTRKLFKQAVKSYSIALYLKPGDAKCLVERGKCRLYLGDLKSALKDAIDSVKSNPYDYRAHLLKADVLYLMRNFEEALANYHIARKLRHLDIGAISGVFKCEGAIGLTEDMAPKKQNKNEMNMSELIALANFEDDRRSAVAKAKDMMELRNDWYFLNAIVKTIEKLYKKTPLNREIFQEAIDTIGDMQAKARFWSSTRYTSSGGQDAKVMKYCNRAHIFLYIANTMEQIDDKLHMHNYQEVQRLCNRYLHEEPILFKVIHNKNTTETVSSFAPVQLSDSFDQSKTDEIRFELLSLTHYYKGCCYLAASNLERALLHFEKDMKICSKLTDKSLLKRGCDNIACVYALAKEYELAIEIFIRRLQTTTDINDLVWLYYQLSHCFLYSNNIDSALEAANGAVEAAGLLPDKEWTCRSLVLLGRLLDVQKRPSDGLIKYTEALEIAKALNNDEFVTVILKAIHEIKFRKTHSN